MKKINKIAILVRLKGKDTSLLEHCRKLAQVNASTEIYLIYVATKKDSNELLNIEENDQYHNRIAEYESRLRTYADDFFGDIPKLNTNILVKFGKVASSLLKIVDAANIDLLVLSKVWSAKKTDKLSMKLARLSPSKLLMLPKHLPEQTEKYMVSIDQSVTDMSALKEAINMASKQNNNPVVICQNICSMPVTDGLSEVDFEKFKSVVAQSAKRYFEKLMVRIDVGKIKVEAEYTFCIDEDPVDIIYHKALEHKPDVVVIGSCELSSTSAWLMSATSEKFLQLNNTFAMKIARERGHYASLVEIIKKE